MRQMKTKSFLPDLCGIRTLLTVIIVAQLLAFVLVLAAFGSAANHLGWHYLGLVSLFVHWVALTSVSLLCLLRRWLSTLSNRAAGVVSYLLILLTTFLMSLIVAGFGDRSAGNGWVLVFALRNMAISAIVAAIALRFIYLHYQQNLASEAQSMAQFQALQARIRPHFLFNSMNTIAALIRTQPERAEEAVEDLAELFRSSLTDAGQFATLESELERAKKYLHIESMRLGPRLKVNWELDSLPARVRLPSLILQPLFENAVYHGIERLPEGGSIDVRLRVDAETDSVTLVIDNPVPETVPPQADGEPPSVARGSQIAIDNIRKRLRYTYGEQAKLYLVSKGGTVSVILNFPMQLPVADRVHDR